MSRTKLLATPENMARIAREDKEPICSKGVFSYCAECGGHYSASAGDYWQCDPEEPLRCCSKPMYLVREVRVIVETV